MANRIIIYMRELAEKIVVSGKGNQYQITSCVEDNKKDGWIVYTARSYPDFGDLYPAGDTTYLLQEFCPKYINSRNDDGDVEVHGYNAIVYEKDLAKYFVKYIDYSNSKLDIEFGVPIDYINDKETGYIIYDYTDWAVNKHIKNHPTENILDVLSGKKEPVINLSSNAPSMIGCR